MDYSDTAALAALVLGFIWYNPKVFGKAWMEDTGMTEEKAKEGNMPLTFGLTFILAGVVAYFLNQYGGYHGEEDQNFMHGMFHGARTALIFVLAPMVTNALYEQKSWRYMFINVAYWILTFAVIGGIVFQF